MGGSRNTNTSHFLPNVTRCSSLFRIPDRFPPIYEYSMCYSDTSARYDFKFNDSRILVVYIIA